MTELEKYNVAFYPPELPKDVNHLQLLHMVCFVEKKEPKEEITRQVANFYWC